MNHQEVISAFEKAEKFFRPNKFWQIFKSDPCDLTGFCTFFEVNQKIKWSDVAFYLNPYFLKHKTNNDFTLYYYHTRQERHVACLLILKELKNKPTN